jgi:hypothetical protein
MNYLSNSFSLNMLSFDSMEIVRVVKIDPVEIPEDVVSQLGHQDIVDIVNNILGRRYGVNRGNTDLTQDDVLYVAQYKGPRLSEGATSLPEGARVDFFEVTLCDGPIQPSVDDWASELAAWQWGGMSGPEWAASKK